MPRQCKCKYCGEKSNIEIAYKSVIDNHNYYFCNQDHYRSWLQNEEQKEHQKELKKNIYSEIRKTLINIPEKSWLEIKTTIKLLNQQYTLDQIYEFLVHESTSILHILNKKTFSREQNKIRYYLAVLKNNIEEYFSLDNLIIDKPQIKEVKDFYMPPVIKYKPSKVRRSIEEIMMGDDNISE